MDDSILRLAKEQANYCRIFSNPHRVMIVWALYSGELSVSDLAQEIQTTIQNTSQHLRLLKDHGLVLSHRRGPFVCYSLTYKALSENSGLVSMIERINKRSNQELISRSSI